MGKNPLQQIVGTNKGHDIIALVEGDRHIVHIFYSLHGIVKVGPRSCSIGIEELGHGGILNVFFLAEGIKDFVVKTCGHSRIVFNQYREYGKFIVTVITQPTTELNTFPNGIYSRNELVLKYILQPYILYF